MPYRKELQFFNDFWSEGLDWYRAHFSGAPAGAVVGEATPTYLMNAHVPQRLATVLPNAKLITLVRNPVDRAYSAYWFRVGYRLEGRSFEEAVANELGGQPTVYPYIGEGRYVRHLERFEQYFPRDRMFVRLLDDLEEDPRGSYADICRFIGVDSSVVPSTVGTVEHQAHRLRSVRFRKLTLRWQRRLKLPERVRTWLYELDKQYQQYPPMDPGLRAQLSAEFAEDNDRLAAWLGRDLSAWNA